MTAPLWRALGGRSTLVHGIGHVLVPVIYLLYAAAVFHMPTEGAVFGPISRAFGIQPNTGFALYDSAGWTVGYAVIGQIPTEADVANGWRLVEMVAEGEKRELEKLVSFLRHGPPAATVQHVEVQWTKELSEYGDFEIRTL